MAEVTRADKFIKKFGLRTMKSLRKTFPMVCGLLLAVLLTQLGAQAPQQGTTPAAPEQNPQSPAQPGRQGKIVFSVNQVVVPVTVKDGSGRLIADLRRDEFRIFEDNVEQRIAYFGADPTPISMVLLIDNDLKSKDARQVSESLRAIVAGLSLNDEAFVCRFDQFFHEGKGFIADQDKLLTELKRTHLDDEPSVGPSSPAISNGPSINGHSAMGDAPNIAGGVLNIKGGSAFFDRRFERLSKYAHDTGGDVYYGLKSRAMEELYAKVTEEARNQYTLAYSPSGTDRGAEYHSIEVRVKREGMTILTRGGYYAGATPR